MSTTSRNRGRLLHGNRSGDTLIAPRCLAKTRSGQKCMAPAMRNPKTGKYSRCRMHGGASTGPKTKEGLERCRQARWKHGFRSAAAIAERKQQEQTKRQLQAELNIYRGLLRRFR
jgi:hypothetical protein